MAAISFAKLRLTPRTEHNGLAVAYCRRWLEAAAQRALRLSPHDPLAAVYCGIAAYAQFVGSNYDKAMRPAREGIR